MFKTIFTIAVAMLCLIFKGEAQENKAIDVTSKGIQIGQKVPDVTITNLHNFKDVKGNPIITVKLSDFTAKLIILDFWATWCSPCVAMIPKMDSLQRQFGEEIQILPVTYQSEKEVLPFLARFQKGKPSVLPQVMGDKELRRLFPHVYLPHYVWIDQTGTVLAITGYEEITATNIEKVLSKGSIDLDLKKKRDMKLAYDKTKPLLINKNGGDGAGLKYHSLLTGYVEGLTSGYSSSIIDSAFKLTATNTSLLNLYAKAFTVGGAVYYGRNRVLLKVKENGMWTYRGNLEEYDLWKLKSLFCYELLLPLARKDEVGSIFQSQLKMLFPQFKAKTALIKTKCYVLIRTSTVDKLLSTKTKMAVSFNAKGCMIEHASLNRFVTQLGAAYLHHLPAPLVDGTEYLGAVDLKINANLFDVKAINAELEKYDLKIIEETRVIDMLVIEDANINNSSH